MDIEDINFLQDLAEELRKINVCYWAEADELENIVLRETEDDMVLMIDLMADFMTFDNSVWYDYGGE